MVIIMITVFVSLVLLVAIFTTLRGRAARGASRQAPNLQETLKAMDRRSSDPNSSYLPHLPPQRWCPSADMPSDKDPIDLADSGDAEPAAAGTVSLHISTLVLSSHDMGHSKQSTVNYEKGNTWHCYGGDGMFRSKALDDAIALFYRAWQRPQPKTWARIEAFLKQAEASLQGNTLGSAVLHRSWGEMLQAKGEFAAAMGHYERALSADSNVGIKRKAAALRKQLAAKTAGAPSPSLPRPKGTDP